MLRPQYLIIPILMTLALVVGAKDRPHRDKHKKRYNPSLFGRGDFDDPDASAAYVFKRGKNPSTGKIPANMRSKELAFAKTLPSHDETSRSAQQWQNRGPVNLGGRTRAVAIDATDENIILAGQASGGMWRSSDAGAHFSMTTKPDQMHSVSCIAQDTRSGKTNVWYYGTGEQYGVVNAAGFSSLYSGNGIFKSTDGGQNWSLLSSTSSNTPTTLYSRRDFDFVWRLVVDHTNTAKDIVYAAVVNGIWRSEDGGASWTPVLGLDTSVSTISQYTEIAISPSGVLYATISSETPSKGIWRSTDGINWTNITPPSLASTFSRIAIGIAPSDESQVYFIAETGNTGATGHQLFHYKYVSGNGTGAGGQWDDRTAKIPNDHCYGFYTFDFRKFSSQNGYDLYIKVKPDDPATVFLGGTNIYRSTDGFLTTAYSWIGGYQCDTVNHSNYLYPSHHPDQHFLLFYPGSNLRCISSNDGGIYRTENIMAANVSWSSLNNGYRTGQFYSCAIEPGNTNSDQIVGGLQDNGSMFCGSADYTKDWQHVFYGDGGYAAIAHQRSNYYLSWQQGKIFKFDISDNGTVNGRTRIDPTGAGNYNFIAPFILDPTDDNYMYLPAGNSIWRNDDLKNIAITGNEYNSISQGWTKITSYTPGGPVSCIDMSAADSNTLYYGTELGTISKVKNTRSSTTQYNITGNNMPASAYVSCVNVDRYDTTKILVSFSNYGVKSIFFTTDGGHTWQDVSGNLEEHPDGSGNGPSVTWVHIYHDVNSTKYFAGTSTGLYSTDALNGMNTIWIQEGASTIGNEIINMITSRPYDGNIVVATHGNGIYSSKIFYPAGVKEIDADGPQLHCYPNPAAEITHIRCTVASNAKVMVTISNAMGQKIMEAAGESTNHTFELDWSGKITQEKLVPAGVYTVQASADGKTTTSVIIRQ